MISKLAKDIFLKETRIESVIGKIDEFSNSYTGDKKTIYESLSTELMKLKKKSVYLNNEATRIPIVAEMGGYVHYLNSMAKDYEVLAIIGPKSLNFNKVLIQVNNIADDSNSEEEYEKKDLPKLKKGLLKEKIDIHFRHEYQNTKNISRLQFLKNQGDEISEGESLGFFEDYEFTATAMDYMTKYNIVDSYCKSKLGKVEKPEKVAKIGRIDLEKQLKLSDAWLKVEKDEVKRIASYNKFIELLEDEHELPDDPRVDIKKQKSSYYISFITKTNNELRWTKFPSKGWQKYMAGMIVACNENKFLNLGDYSTRVWMAICQNTFLDSTDNLSQDAFDEMRAPKLNDKFMIPFRKMLKKIK